MKLQDASKKEIKRIAKGTAVCDLLLIAGLFILSLGGIGKFDYKVFTGVLGGSVVAVLNFTVMCLTIQKAVDIDEKKQMKSFIQGSYNGRLLLQAGWVVAAFLIPHVNVIAAAIPLLFPNLVIFYLQYKGKLVTPSERTAAPADDSDEPEDRLESFEV
jgi:hypothetical protein